MFYHRALSWLLEQWLQRNHPGGDAPTRQEQRAIRRIVRHDQQQGVCVCACVCKKEVNLQQKSNNIIEI